MQATGSYLSLDTGYPYRYLSISSVPLHKLWNIITIIKYAVILFHISSNSPFIVTTIWHYNECSSTRVVKQPEYKYLVFSSDYLTGNALDT
jgi:hypothetical protein